MNKNSLAPLAILLIIGLLGLNVYQWYSNDKLNTTLNEKNTEYYELEKIQTELEQDYQTALENLEDLRGSNEAQNAMIESQKAELKAQKNKISGLIWTKGELEKAKSELAVLNQQAADALSQVRSLQSKNQALTQEVAVLSQEKVQLKEEIVQTKTVVEQLDSDKKELTSQKAELTESNEELSSKVNVAEAIKINSIVVEGFLVEDDGDIKQKKRAKKVDMLRTCIKTETNMVAPAGEQVFQIRFVAPSGQTMANDQSGSGVLTEQMSGMDFRYSTIGKVDYKNTDAEACFDWNPGMNFEKGNYAVQVFNNEFLVGNGTFELK